MPQNYGFRNSRRHQKPKERSETAAAGAAEEQNPLLKAFRGYAQELDNKHDRNERIVKLSRDITIESKRIIFLLHTIDARKNNKAKVLEEAQQRLNKLIEVNFKGVANELVGQDPFQFRWAYSPGLQEFIEAYSFMEYFKSTTETALEDGTMSDWNALQAKMHYEEQKQEPAETPADKKCADTDIETATTEAGNESPGEDKGQPTVAEISRKFHFFVDPTEYILGVSDLTGELMRRCINSLGSGETDACLATCKALQHFYTGYLGLNVMRCRELSRKISTMRQSVLKAENVCYNVKVRGGEAAKWGAVFDGKPSDDVDEGFY